MNDNESIDVLGLHTLYRNALVKNGVITIGELKNCIKAHGLDCVSRIGTSGKREIVQAIISLGYSDDTDLKDAIEYYKAQYESYCKILNKICPENANVPKECENCNLHIVYNGYIKRAIEMNKR